MGVLSLCRSGEAAQHGAHRTRIERGELEWQGDQFVIAGGHVVKHEPFEDGEAVFAHGVVRVHGLGGLRVERGGVDANELDAVRGHQCDRLGRNGGKVVVPRGLRHLCVRAQQHAGRCAGQRFPHVFRLDARYTYAVDNAAWAQVGVQRHLADGSAIRAVVQRGIGMRTRVRRERDASDVDWAVTFELPRNFLRKRRIAGPSGRGRREGGADVPQSAFQGGSGAENSLNPCRNDREIRAQWVCIIVRVIASDSHKMQSNQKMTQGSAKNATRYHRSAHSAGVAGRRPHQQPGFGGARRAVAVSVPAAGADAGRGRRHHRLSGATGPRRARAGTGSDRAGVDAPRRDGLARDVHGRRAELARDRGRLHHHWGLQLHPARAGAQPAALLGVHHRAAVQDAWRDGHPLEYRSAHHQGPRRRSGAVDGSAGRASARGQGDGQGRESKVESGAGLSDENQSPTESMRG